MNDDEENIHYRNVQYCICIEHCHLPHIVACLNKKPIDHIANLKNISFFYSILKCSNVILFKGIVKLLYIMRFDNTLNKTLKKKFTFWTSFTCTIKIKDALTGQ